MLVQRPSLCTVQPCYDMCKMRHKDGGKIGSSFVLKSYHVSRAITKAIKVASFVSNCESGRSSLNAAVIKLVLLLYFWVYPGSSLVTDL